MVLGALLTARLGVWQLSRYDQKESALQALRDQHALEPLTHLPTVPGEFRRVRLSGRYRPEALIVSGGIAFGKNGYAVIGVFDTDEDGTLLVQRGWIPSHDWVRYRAMDTSSTTVEGVIHHIEGAPDVQSVVDIRTGETLWPLERERFLRFFSRGVNIPWTSLTQATPGANSELVLLQGPELTDPEARKLRTLPAPGYVLERKTLHHLEYAAQWFGFSGLMVLIWGIVGWRRAKLLKESRE